MGTVDQSTMLQGCRVLVVEDDFLIADDFNRKLALAGARVAGPVATLDAAKTVYLHHPMPHVAILDVNLRGTLVFPFASRLLADGIPFVFCTGYGDDLIPACFASVPRFEKPLSQQSFVEMIHEIQQLPEAGLQRPISQWDLLM